MADLNVAAEPPPSDADLVARCRAGDAAAWQAVVMRYQRLVLAVTRRAGLDEHASADVFQTVFARLVEHLPGLRDGDRLQAWIVTTTKREAMALRARARRLQPIDGADGEPGLLDDLPDDAPLAEDTLSHLQQLHRLRQAMERLDERCRQLLQLVFRDDDEALSYEEVGRRMNMPVGSLGPTRTRCLGKLRKLVE